MRQGNGCDGTMDETMGCVVAMGSRMRWKKNGKEKLNGMKRGRGRGGRGRDEREVEVEGRHGMGME